MELKEKVTIAKEREKVHTAKASSFIHDQGLEFKASLISVYMHGKPCSFTGIKTSIGITTRFRYYDDLYGLS
jgi:hypothetical protein